MIIYICTDTEIQAEVVFRTMEMHFSGDMTQEDLARKKI